MMNPEIAMSSFDVYAEGFDHPECLTFDRQGALWAGGEAGQIYRVGPGGGTAREIANIGGFIGGLAFSPDDELLVCSVGVGLVRVKSDGRHVLFADRAGAHKLVCPNFGVFDSRGNYFLSDSGGWRTNDGCLLRFTPDGKGEVIGGPFAYANGLALSADERWLFMVETDTRIIYRFELDRAGRLGPAQRFAKDVDRMPDGLVLDAAGNLYVCGYASDDIHRITPEGEVSLVAYDPESMLLSAPTNMAFGGDEFDELYIANLGRTRITRARLGCKGQPLANGFAGA